MTANRVTPRLGAAMLEFAIGAGLLLILFGTSFQFGYTFFVYNNLENAVNRGARYSSLLKYDSATATLSNSYLTEVQNMVLYGSPAAGNSPVLRGLTAANVTVTMVFVNGRPGQTTVSINGYTIHSLFGTTTFSNKPRITYSYQGIWNPI